MKLEGLSILVTGGAGFIGSHLAKKLAEENQVVVYDNFSSSVVSVRDLMNIRVIKGDILDRKKLKHAMRGVDMVFHLAVACVRLSLENPLFVHDTNATGTLTTLLAAKGARVKRFIYISSSEVYGTAQKPNIDENHPINPTTVYGASKYMGEEYTRLFSAQLPSIIIRPFNTYGPRSHFDGVYGEVIPRFVIRALNKKPPIIFGKGNQTRDFTYVTDSVDGIIRAAEFDELVGDVVNIAYGREVSINEIAKEVCTATSLPFKPVSKPARPNDVARHAADITKAKKLLKFSPTIGIREGIKRYAAWLKQTYPDLMSLLGQIPERNW